MLISRSVSVVIAATSGGLVAGALPNQNHQLWTLVISYIFWGIESPLSWIILTLYFLRMTVHKSLKREVIVSLLLPIGPLGLSGLSSAKPEAFGVEGHRTLKNYSLIVLGKLAKSVFAATDALPHVARAGDVFYLIGVGVGIILWGFAIVWFIVAVMMIATAGGFPFNMGWWGFIFPVGQCCFVSTSLYKEIFLP